MPANSPNLTLLLADAARGLGQQMILWGHDVKHPWGNALTRFGLDRRPSPGLQGTSCYAMAWENGLIELHGAIASWCPPVGACGCSFCRDQGSITLWDRPTPPIPGVETGTSGSPCERWASFQPFLRWLISYEQWIAAEDPADWRERTWRTLKKLPTSRPWLPPALALRWWELALAGHPPRPKSFLRHNP